MERLKPLKNIVNNAFRWGIDDLAKKLGVDAESTGRPEFSHLTKTWNTFNTIADAIRSLDDRTLEVLTADPSPEDCPEIPDGI